MNNSFLDTYKKIYKQSTIPKESVDQSWGQVKYRLPQQDKKEYVSRHAVFITAASLLLFLVSFVSIVQAARPGEPLYPVKILQDKVIGNVIGKPEITVKKRAHDVIKTTHEQPETLKKATDAYKDALQNATSEIQNKSDEKKNDLKDTLQEQEKKLEHAQSEHPQSQELLDKAIEETRKSEGEVKGSATSPDTKAQEGENEKKDENKQDEQKSNTQNNSNSEGKHTSGHHEDN